MKTSAASVAVLASLLLALLPLAGCGGDDSPGSHTEELGGVGHAPGFRDPLANCVSCHGSKGKGDGPAAVALNPKPADWTSKRVQDMSDGEIFWKMTTGRGAMPSWRHLPENDRWAVVRYIRTLAGK